MHLIFKECAKARSQPTPTSVCQHHEKNAEVSDFSPYEYQPKGDIKKQNTSVSTIDESQLKVRKFIFRILIKITYTEQ